MTNDSEPPIFVIPEPQSSEVRRPQSSNSDIQVTALLVLESLVRYYVRATGELDEQQVRHHA